MYIAHRNCWIDINHTLHPHAQGLTTSHMQVSGPKKTLRAARVQFLAGHWYKLSTHFVEYLTGHSPSLSKLPEKFEKWFVL